MKFLLLSFLTYWCGVVPAGAMRQRQNEGKIISSDNLNERTIKCAGYYNKANDLLSAYNAQCQTMLKTYAVACAGTPFFKEDLKFANMAPEERLACVNTWHLTPSPVFEPTLLSLYKKCSDAKQEWDASVSQYNASQTDLEKALSEPYLVKIVPKHEQENRTALMNELKKQQNSIKASMQHVLDTQIRIGALNIKESIDTLQGDRDNTTAWDHAVIQLQPVVNPIFALYAQTKKTAQAYMAIYKDMQKLLRECQLPQEMQLAYNQGISTTQILTTQQLLEYARPLLAPQKIAIEALYKKMLEAQELWHHHIIPYIRAMEKLEDCLKQVTVPSSYQPFFDNLQQKFQEQDDDASKIMKQTYDMKYMLQYLSSLPQHIS